MQGAVMHMPTSLIIPCRCLVEIQPVLVDADAITSTSAAQDDNTTGTEQRGSVDSSSMHSDAAAPDAAVASPGRQHEEDPFTVSWTASASRPGYGLMAVHVAADAASTSAGSQAPELAQGAVRRLAGGLLRACVPLQNIATLRCWYASEAVDGQALDTALQAALQAGVLGASEADRCAALAAALVPVLELHSSVALGPACMLLEALVCNL